MNQLDEIEQEIRNLLIPIPNNSKESRWTDSEWTKEIMNLLGKLGKENGFYVCGTDCKQYGQGEWLYDLVWLIISDSYLVDVPLILECEWSTNLEDISEDFLKLLVGRAQHRVMIFQKKTLDEVKETISKLESHVIRFKGTQRGDRYLFIGFDWVTTHQFSFKLFVK